MHKRRSQQHIVQSRIETYCDRVQECLNRFKSTIDSACADCTIESIREGFRSIHEAEGAADDIRREVETIMYSRSIFPESRGDILGLIESIDRVPNSAESSVRMIITNRINLSLAPREKIIELANVCTRSATVMIDGVRQLFEGFLDAAVTAGKIDMIESEADQIESILIEQIFDSDAPDLQKILLRDLSHKIGSIADRAEQVGDRIRIMVAKRSL